MTTLVHMGQPPSLASAHCSHHTVTGRSDRGQLGGLVGAVWWQAVRGQLEGHASHSSHFLVGGVAALLDGWDINVGLVVKGRLRETDWYSIVAEEWPSRRDAMLAWLDPANFGPDGTALKGMAELRG